MNLIVRLIISTISILLASYVIPGVFVDNTVSAVLVAIVLGLLNAIVRPILVLLTLPINILTLGLFTFIINALIVMLASSIIPGFRVQNILSALLFSLVVSLLSSFINGLI